MAMFMTMYPAYRYRDILEEYAITFYALLLEGYRIRHKHYETLAVIAELPSADPDYKKEYYRNLQYATMYPGDILKQEGQGSSPTEIKKLLGG